jgi:hypothetical protein
MTGCIRTAALLLLLIVGRAGAGAIYRCVDASDVPAFQAVPCAALSAQTVMKVHPQPLIDAGARPLPVPVVRATHASSRESHARVHAHGTRGERRAQATSWECRAADGEVFYRHSRCPHSVPGDGVMRSTGRYVIRRGRGTRGARDAWSPVSVHARKVSRALACSRINAVAAVERDGHARDERVSAYEHNVGRDPCRGY